MTARRVVESRSCEGCGSAFGRRRFPSGRLEGVSQFVERRFCGRACLELAIVEGAWPRPVGERVLPTARRSASARGGPLSP